MNWARVFPDQTPPPVVPQPETPPYRGRNQGFERDWVHHAGRLAGLPAAAVEFLDRADRRTLPGGIRIRSVAYWVEEAQAENLDFANYSAWAAEGLVVEDNEAHEQASHLLLEATADVIRAYEKCCQALRLLDT